MQIESLKGVIFQGSRSTMMTTEDVQDATLDEGEVHVGSGGGYGKSMTRSLPRGILEARGRGTMDGVDSVVEIAGTVDIDRGKSREGCEVAVEGGGECIVEGGDEHGHEN